MENDGEQSIRPRDSWRRPLAVLVFVAGAALSAWLGWYDLLLSIGTTVTVAINLPFVVRNRQWSAPRLIMIAAETGYIGGAIAVWVARFVGGNA